MIESVQVRQRGAYDFESHYDNLCAMQDSCPLPAVKAHLAQNVLDINGDRVRVTDWMPILNTLRINKSLEFIAIRSYYTPPSEDNEKKANIERRKMPSVRSKEITYRLCKALKECLMNTPTLSCIELQGLPLRERDLTTLMKGLVKNQTLNHLSLEYCRIGDTGLDIVCKGAKNSTSINSVNFTGCSLSGRGAESLAKVIKHQAMKRHNEAWRDSLRYRRPDLDRMPGIRRITINNNPMMGDQGASLLAEALKDDLWLKALDMQGTGVSTTGARALLDVLKYNTTIVVLDVRRNPLIDRDVVHNIMEQLMINCNGQDTEYKWIKADDPVESNKKALAKKRRTKTLNSSFGRKTTIRITAGAARRRTKSTGSVGVSRKVQPISSEEVKAGPGLPWRTAARANRYRGYPPEHIPGMARLFENSEASPPSSPDQSASIIITKDDSLAEDDTLQELERLKLDDSGLLTGINKMNNIKDLRVEIVQLKRRLHEERIARANAEDRVVKLTIENKRLREQMETVGYSKGGGILDDDSVLDTIEASFKQFHEFLDLLRDAGLGQLITMAGLDRQGSPFAQQGRSTFPQKMSQFKSSSSIPPRPVKPNMKSNGYFGDISSSNWVSASHSSKEEEKPVKFGKFFDQESPNKFSYFSARDPTMDSHLDDSHQNGGPSKKDDLYDRIVNETSGAFPHLTQNGNSENVLQMKSQMGAAEKSYQKPENAEKQDTDKAKRGLMEEDYSFEKSDIDQSESQSHSSKPIPQPRGRKSSAEEGGYDSKLQEQGKDTSNENIHLLSEKEIPEHKSKVSEVNYSMDSFEQSYLSERGEVIHLEGDFDMYDSSPSLPPQVIDSEENDF